MADLQTNLQRLENNSDEISSLVTDISDAITAKGGTVPSNAGLRLFPAAINSIPSGGVEFSNTPAAFSLLTNIQNLDVIIPNGVTVINSAAFRYCTGLRSIEIPNSVSTIGNYAFENCTGLRSIEIPNSVSTIGESAFSGLNIESLEIPNNVSLIKGNACAYLTKLKSLKFISSTPPTIYTNAFYQLNTGCTIYVPTGTLSAYTAAANMPSTSTYTYLEY